MLVKKDISWAILEEGWMLMECEACCDSRVCDWTGIWYANNNSIA